MSISNTTINNCSLLDLNLIHNRAGNITIVEERQSIPFIIKRIYYLYDIPGGEERGGHAHKELHQLVIAASGSFKIVLDDGKQKKTVPLNHPKNGILIVPGIWRELIEFSSGATCLVIASHLYDENDYIRNYSSFLNYKK